MHLPILLLTTLALTAASQASLPLPDAGYWTIIRRHGGSATGWRWSEIISTHSKAPSTTILCRWSQDPSTRIEEKSCNATNFSYAWGAENYPDGVITLKQTVLLQVQAGSAAMPVNVTGSGLVPFTCGGVNGRTCEGSGRVNATAGL